MPFSRTTESKRNPLRSASADRLCVCYATKPALRHGPRVALAEVHTGGAGAAPDLPAWLRWLRKFSMPSELSDLSLPCSGMFSPPASLT